MGGQHRLITSTETQCDDPRFEWGANGEHSTRHLVLRQGAGVVTGQGSNLVGEVISIATHIDNADNVQGRAEQTLVAEGLEHHTADTAEPVDSDFDSRHDGRKVLCTRNVNT